MAEQRPCRCLLMASGQADMARLVAEYIAALPEESRVPEETYQDRLTLCQQCEALHSGTCARCGCYVEARAAKRSLSCPDAPPRWKACE